MSLTPKLLPNTLSHGAVFGLVEVGASHHPRAVQCAIVAVGGWGWSARVFGQMDPAAYYPAPTAGGFNVAADRWTSEDAPSSILICHRLGMPKASLVSEPSTHEPHTKLHEVFHTQ